MLLSLVPIALPALAACRFVWAGGAVAILSLVFSAAGSLALLGTHIGAARYFRIPFWYGLLFPMGYLIGSFVLVFAAWQRSRGQTRWKGRVYPAGKRVAPGSTRKSANEAAST
jgi:chlorobactene glucosyltransferase